MVKRSILLPAIGDPYLLALWFKLYASHFLAEVDEVVVAIERKEKPILMDLNASLIEWLNGMPGVRAYEADEAGMTSVFNKCLQQCQGDTFVIVQEDAFIFKRGELTRHFQKIEQGEVDVIGTPMYCYSAILNDVMYSYTNPIEREFCPARGYSLWQNFLFARMADFKRTDRIIAPQTWEANIRVPFLGWLAPEPVSLDLFASVIFQWRAMGLKFGYVSQGLNLGLDDIRYFNAPCHWLHVNSLSSIMTGLMHKQEVGRLGDDITREMERRLLWWLLAYEDNRWGMRLNIGSEFEHHYHDALEFIITTHNVSLDYIRERMANIRRLVYA